MPTATKKDPLAKELLEKGAEDFGVSPKAFQYQFLKEAMEQPLPGEPEEDPAISEKKAQRDALYQKLVNNDMRTKQKDELASALIHAMSGFAILGGEGAASGAINRSRELYNQRHSDMREDVRTEATKDFGLLKLADAELASGNAARSKGYGAKVKAVAGSRDKAAAEMGRMLRGEETAAHNQATEDIGRMNARSNQMRASKTAGAPSDPFDTQAKRTQAKLFEERKKSTVQMAAEVDNVDRALAVMKNYKGSTGKLQTGFGLTKHISPDTQLLDATFNRVSLANMQRIFQGMARSIDSDVEREFFQSTQPSITNFGATNAAILLGAKYMAAKHQAEVDAQEDYVAQHGNLTGYTSPLVGLTGVVDGNNQVHLIPKAQLLEARQQGLLPPDEFVQKNWGTQHQRRMPAAPPQTTLTPMVRPSGRTPEEEARYQELLNKAKQ